MHLHVQSRVVVNHLAACPNDLLYLVVTYGSIRIVDRRDSRIFLFLTSTIGQARSFSRPIEPCEDPGFLEKHQQAVVSFVSPTMMSDTIIGSGMGHLSPIQRRLIAK